MEIKELLEVKLDQLGNQIDAKINQANQAIKDNLDEKLDNFKAQELEKLQSDYKALDTTLNNIIAERSRIKGINDDRANFGDTLRKQLSESESFKSFVAGNSKSGVINLHGKRLDMMFKGGADMTPAGNLTGEVVAPDRVPGIIFDPDRAEHVRDFIPTASTTSDTIYYVREEAYDDYTAPVTPGNAKPQSEFDLKQFEAPVRDIATFIRLHRNMLNDINGMTGYITTRMPKKLKLVEDAQILYGDGNAPNLKGITEEAQAYVDTLADANVNRFDVLVKAIAQARNDEYRANAVMINVADWYNLLLLKDEDGQYLMPEAYRFGAVAPRIAGVPLIGTTAITAGDFLVGDFGLGVQVFDREQSNIRFFEQDADNVTKNLVTVRVEERLALPVYRPKAFVYGNFAAALAQGSA
jgi:HK97 family phage major capsid protein